MENRVAVGAEIVSGTPKSKASTRKLPMPDEVVDVLRAARKRQAEQRLAFGSGYRSGEYVTSDELGQPCHPNLLTFRWGRMLDGLGIKPGTTARCAAVVRDAHAPARSQSRTLCPQSDSNRHWTDFKTVLSGVC